MLFKPALFTGAFWACALANGIAKNAPAVTIRSGPVEGIVLASDVKAYLGIPFALSPPERFSAPVDPKPWTTPLKASAVKPACVQEFPGPETAQNFTKSIFSNPMPEESEDCLYLNVWVPSKAPPPGGYPVMFWIYGGNLQFGTASLPMYSGEHIAANRDVLLVSTNYRTNVFGFPNSPELPKGEGNPGFLDQRKALDWVQKNIREFGGDPEKVTIFGESAGGWSVKQLIANPPLPLPFRAAIMQSEAAGVSGGAAAWRTLSTALSCTGNNTLSCVRQAPAKKIKDILEKESLSFDPIKDDITCSSNISLAITSGKAAKVPFIIGSNAEDGSAFAVIYGGGVASNTPEAAATAKSLTDITFQCPAATLASLAASNGYTAYRYYFNATFPQNSPFLGAGAFHSAEIEPIFGTYDPKRLDVNRLSGSLQTRWTTFAKDPTAPLAAWPKVGKGFNPVLVLGSSHDDLVDATTIDTSCAAMAADIELNGL